MNETELECLIECMKYICYNSNAQTAKRLVKLLEKLKQEYENEQK